MARQEQGKAAAWWLGEYGNVACGEVVGSSQEASPAAADQENGRLASPMEKLALQACFCFFWEDLASSFFGNIFVGCVFGSTLDTLCPAGIKKSRDVEHWQMILSDEPGGPACAAGISSQQLCVLSWHSGVHSSSFGAIRMCRVPTAVVSTPACQETTQGC